VLHLAVLERIVVAILGVVSFFPSDYQRKRGSGCLLDGYVCHVRADEPVRGGVHFKHGRGGLVVDVLVHRARVSNSRNVIEIEMGIAIGIAIESESESRQTWPPPEASTRRMNRFPAVESRGMGHTLIFSSGEYSLGLPAFAAFGLLGFSVARNDRRDFLQREEKRPEGKGENEYGSGKAYRERERGKEI